MKNVFLLFAIITVVPCVAMDNNLVYVSGKKSNKRKALDLDNITRTRKNLDKELIHTILNNQGITSEKEGDNFHKKIESLLAEKASPDVWLNDSCYGNIPLIHHIANECSSYPLWAKELIGLFIQHKANLNIQNNSGETALFCCSNNLRKVYSSRNYPKKLEDNRITTIAHNKIIINCLIDANADLTIVDNKQATFLHELCHYSPHTDLILSCLERKASLLDKNRFERTPLCYFFLNDNFGNLKGTDYIKVLQHYLQQTQEAQSTASLPLVNITRTIRDNKWSLQELDDLCLLLKKYTIDPYQKAKDYHRALKEKKYNYTNQACLEEHIQSIDTWSKEVVKKLLPEINKALEIVENKPRCQFGNITLTQEEIEHVYGIFERL